MIQLGMLSGQGTSVVKCLQRQMMLVNILVGQLSFTLKAQPKETVSANIFMASSSEMYFQI
jgi:hypothetical protein